MARRRDALSRHHRDQSAGVADALLAGGRAGPRPRRRARVHGLRLRILSIAAGLGLAAAILRRAGLLDRLGALGGSIALVAFAVLPGQSFDDRDQLAAVYGLPFLAVSAARRRARRSTRGWRFWPASAPA